MARKGKAQRTGESPTLADRLKNLSSQLETSRTNKEYNNLAPEMRKGLAAELPAPVHDAQIACALVSSVRKYNVFQLETAQKMFKTLSMTHTSLLPPMLKSNMQDQIENDLSDSIECYTAAQQAIGKVECLLNTLDARTLLDSLVRNKCSEDTEETCSGDEVAAEDSD